MNGDGEKNIVLKIIDIVIVGEIMMIKLQIINLKEVLEVK